MRIHRSYIVNSLRIDEYRSSHIVIGNETIEISRKYKDEVQQHFLADGRLEKTD